jgi:hypothetical protein
MTQPDALSNENEAGLEKKAPLKVLNLCISDSGAGAYSLSHALNKRSDVESISLRTSNSWVNYPAMAEARVYGKEGCKKLVEAADVVIFHSAVRPFFDAFNLDKEILKAKRKFLYFHGSDCRNNGLAIMEDAREVMGAYEILLSTPDLLDRVPNGFWLPVARDFDAIHANYAATPKDRAALENWGAFKKKTVLAHAPTNVELKGSPVFYKIITEVIDTIENVDFLSIKDVPWDTCLRMLTQVNVLYDQFILGGYGMISVEASVFGAACFCNLAPRVCDVMEKESGLPQPFIQWNNEDELRTQSFMLAQEPDLQHKFGAMTTQYCRKMHDDVNVAERFMRILEKTA